MNPKQHQKLVRGNIAAAMAMGDVARADVLKRAYADLLAIKLPDEPDARRLPASPINTIKFTIPPEWSKP